MNAEAPGPAEIRRPSWPRALRPLLWWFLLVAVLFGIRTHQRLSEKTHLSFSVSLQGRQVSDEAEAELAGRPVNIGASVPIGCHRLRIFHPKAAPFSTNLFIWYGENDLGRISLERGMGTLAVVAQPSATVLTISGPQFNRTLTNTTGLTSSVPIDTYMLQAKYAHFEKRAEMNVALGTTNTWRITPRLGAIELSCNREGASFALVALDGRVEEAGQFPAKVFELPEGTYSVKAEHHRNRKAENLIVKAGATNAVLVNFEYGTAVFETEPVGATVASVDGTEWGITPLTLSELKPGPWQFSLRKEGYEPVEISLLITVQETNGFRTNLVSRNYTSAIKAAREYLISENYDRAIEAASDALRVKPEDETARALQGEATGLRSMRQAETFGKEGKYAAAIQELVAALKTLPGNQRARTMLAEFKERQSEEAEKSRLARLNRPREVFAQRLALGGDSALFESHEIKTKKKAAVVSAAIFSALRDQAPTFTVGLYTSQVQDVTEIVAKRESWGQARMCVVVIGQITDDETQILFEVMEYKIDVAGKVLGTLLSVQGIGGQSNTNPVDPRVPLHPSRVGQLTDKMKAQIEEGVRIVTERIQGAIGQTATVNP